MAWFTLDPAGSPIISSNYSLANPSPPTGCSGSDQICAVQTATAPGNIPVLSSALKDEMITALHNRTASANVQLKNS